MITPLVECKNESIFLNQRGTNIGPVTVLFTQTNYSQYYLFTSILPTKIMIWLMTGNKPAISGQDLTQLI